MKTILKKSLALAICVALCLTAFIGSLSVSATGTATAVISTANVANGTASTSLTVTISGSPNIVGARFDIVADATKLTLGTPTISSGATLTETSTPADNTTRFILTADDLSTGLASVVVTLPYTIVNPSTAGTIDVAFGTLKEVAEVGETLMTVTPTNGSITVQAAHVHDFSGAWQSNANYHWKVCPADDETGNQAAHTFGAWTTTVQPTCTATGTKTHTCTVCGYVESDTVAATGHTPAAAAQENVVAATCTAAGGYDTVVRCSTCNAVISSEHTTVPATGHTWNAGVVTTAPGCTTEGVLTKTCTVCGATDTEVISATGHTAGAAADEDIVAPTCTAAGSHNSVVRCTVCNAIISSTHVVDEATGHTPAAAVQEDVVAATCGAAGSYDSVVYCSVCNAEISRETVNVPATGEHTAAAAVQENVVAATCGVAGSYDSVVYCSVCNAEISRTTGNVIPATGEHTWGAYTSNADGHSRTCTVCGATDTATSGAHTGNPCSVCGYEAAVSSCEHENLTPVGISGGNFVFTCDDCDEEVLIPVAAEVYGSNTGVANSIMPTNDISLFFYFRQDRTSAFTNLVLKVEKMDYLTDTTKTYYLADEGLVDTGRPDHILSHQFTFSDLAAYEMGTNVTATLYGLTSGGEMMQLKVANYSVLTYVNNTLAASHPASLKKALVDMLNYGAYCQVYGNYNTDNLVNAGLTSDQQAMATQVSDYPTSSTSFVTTSSLGLSLSRPDQTTPVGRVSCPRSVFPGAKAFIEYVLAPQGGSVNDLYASFDYYDVNGNAAETEVFSYAEDGIIFQGNSAFQFDLAPISTLTYPVTMHLYYGDPATDGVEVLTAPYSIETYIAAVLSDPVKYPDVNLQNLLKSMYAFGHSLASYAGIDNYSI